MKFYFIMCGSNLDNYGCIDYGPYRNSNGYTILYSSIDDAKNELKKFPTIIKEWHDIHFITDGAPKNVEFDDGTEIAFDMVYADGAADYSYSAYIETAEIDI